MPPVNAFSIEFWREYGNSFDSLSRDGVLFLQKDKISGRIFTKFALHSALLQSKH